ncbi:MAG: VCBS repeat-containing protein [Planctomycetes bacterium]|nr:VCBS repeat-containing protein [Planctomycetota bacterium]
MKLPLLSVLAFTATTVLAQSPTFAKPVRMQAGGKLLGGGRLYPSPVLHDLDGDGRADIVVGDLRGRLTVAKRTADATPTFAAESNVLGADQKQVDLQNW